MTTWVTVRNPGALTFRLYVPGMPGKAQAVAVLLVLHCMEPVAAPDISTETPATGPPVAAVTLIVIASGSGQGCTTQSLSPSRPHPANTAFSTPRPRTTNALGAMRAPPRFLTAREGH